MINFKTVKDNEEYIIFNGKKGLEYLIKDDQIKEKIKVVASSIYFDTFKYENENKIPSISEIAIRVDSVIGIFLMENDLIYSENLIVSYNKIINAFNIAIFENNPIVKSILPLFKNQISGKKDELIGTYSSEVIEYILNNDDFNYYIERLNRTYQPKEYIVYENGEFTKRILLNDVKNRAKKFKNQ